MVAALAVRLIPFAWLQPWLGLQAPPVRPVTGRQARRAKQIARLIGRAEARAPWQVGCFAQALVARAVLGWMGLPSAISFGLRHDARTGGMRAHCWAGSGQIGITGGAGPAGFHIVGVFSRPAADGH